MGIIGAISNFLLSLAQSFLVLPLVTLFATIDGFFPPIPSESVVISLASIYASAGDWGRIALLTGFAAIGAFAGDNIAYWIGHFFQPGRWRVFATGKGHTAYAWATRQFRVRGAPLLFAARYIPVGRVAVNVVAGSIRFRYAQFVAIDALASLTWGIYSTILGVVGGSVAGDNPLIAIGVGMVIGVGVGAVVQKVVGKRLGMTGFHVDDGGDPPPAAGDTPVDGEPPTGG
ncbi:MAG: VTT domain-containing protein [Bifidobacteriaceae bacterium]|nr:VTT domain-containing protein [Bifidobacteriaceae bacterium]